MLDHFWHTGTNGRHKCMTFEAGSCSAEVESAFLRPATCIQFPRWCFIGASGGDGGELVGFGRALQTASCSRWLSRHSRSGTTTTRAFPETSVDVYQGVQEWTRHSTCLQKCMTPVFASCSSQRCTGQVRRCACNAPQFAMNKSGARLQVPPTRLSGFLAERTRVSRT